MLGFEGSTSEQKISRRIISINTGVDGIFYPPSPLKSHNNPDYPAVLKREDFVIDIDAYSMDIIYHDDLAQFIDDMHFEVQNCFEKMITDDYRTALNERV